jgi:NDP-sugar pyrophosphorylase family protein
LIGKECVIGNSTEIKNSILFDKVQVPHYNYIGDSILGYKAHLGAGAVTSNVKSDKSNICLIYKGEKIYTKMKKFGAIIGDECEIGCGCVLNPGTIIGRNTTIYPLTSVRGVKESNCIVKSQSICVSKNPDGKV